MTDEDQEHTWPCRSGNLAQAGFSGRLGPADLSYPAWVLPNFDGVWATSPLIDNRQFIILCSPSGLSVLAREGHVVVTVDIELTAGTTPLLHEQTLYLAAKNAVVGAIDLGNGSERWRAKFAACCNEEGWSLGIAGGCLILCGREEAMPEGVQQGVGVLNTHVYALDIATRQVVWKFRPQMFPLSFQPSVVDGRLLFQDMSGTIYCLDAASGTKQWQALLRRKGATSSSGAVAVAPNGFACMTSNTKDGQGALSAYRIADGTHQWTTQFGLEANSPPSVLPTTDSCEYMVVLGLGASAGLPPQPRDGPIGQVVAVDVQKGRQLWCFTPERLQTLAPSQHPWLLQPWTGATGSGDCMVYIGWHDGDVFALDGESGEAVSHFQGSGLWLHGTPALGDGFLLVSAVDKVLAFGAGLKAEPQPLAEPKTPFEQSGLQHQLAQRHGDPWKAGLSRFSSPTRLGDPAWTFELAWVGFPGWTSVSPIIDVQGNIYVKMRARVVLVFFPDGTHRGTVELSTCGLGSSTPALEGDSLFAVDELGFMVSVSIETGAVNWRTKYSDSYEHSAWPLAVGRGLVFAQGRTVGGMFQLVAVDAQEGSVRWTFNLGSNWNDRNQESDLPFFEDLVLYPTASCDIYALRIDDGSVQWKIEGDGNYCNGGVTVCPQGFAVANRNWGCMGGLRGYDAHSGRELWRLVGEHMACTPVIVPLAGDRLVCAVGVGYDCLDPGNFDWSLGWWAPSPSYILGVDARTGEWLWRFEPPIWRGESTEPPERGDPTGWSFDSIRCGVVNSAWGQLSVNWDGIIYCPWEGGRLFMIDAQSGLCVSQSSEQVAIKGSTALGEGLVAVVSGDKLLVWNADAEELAPPPAQAQGERWVVIGGKSTGGIVVRAESSTKSRELGRLGCAAVVRELDLQGERLHYEKLTGLGPDRGWVSLKLKDKDLLVRCYKVPGFRLPWVEEP